ncbi:diadenylate cyclase [Planctomycetota bacterium]
MIDPSLLTRAVLDGIHPIASRLKPTAILAYAGTLEAADLLKVLTEKDWRLILAVRDSTAAEAARKITSDVIEVPPFLFSRLGQIKIAVLVSLTRGVLKLGDVVLCVTGLAESSVLDTIVLIEIGQEYEVIANIEGAALPPDTSPEVFERVIELAEELALEGREGRSLGTIFVLGDADGVAGYCQQLVLNPFQGYEERERNILDPHLEETIKEYANLDGAFVIRGDGVVLSAGTLLHSHQLKEPQEQGLGARHAAAAAITAVTEAVALAISQSTGDVRVYRSGHPLVVLEKPQARVRNA